LHLTSSIARPVRKRTEYFDAFSDA
jgi:hypothetical protein